MPIPPPATAPALLPPDTTTLTLAARRLADLADQTRAHAGVLTAAATAGGWRSTAATACRQRLADLAGEVLGAAALLDRASLTLDDHARTAAHRAATLADAAGDLARVLTSPGVLVGAGALA